MYKTCTISRLAKDAGVSINIIRDYEMRGLFCPYQYKPDGYRIYKEEFYE